MSYKENEACRRISRGQVWFLVDNDVPLVHTQGSVIGKNRPWLVVSNNKCNQSSPVYTVVPLTTSTKEYLPTHVTFMLGDKQNTILCEQPRSVSLQAFFNAGSYYKCMMSEKYMKLVDEALAVHFGIALVFPNSDRYWESLERLIRVRVKQAIADSKVDAIDISKVVTLLDDKVEAIVNETVDPKPVTVEAEKEEPPVEDQVQEPEEPKVKHKRRHWTDEEKKKFLEYCENFGTKSAASFYDMQLGSVYTTRLKFLRELRDKKEQNNEMP